MARFILQPCKLRDEWLVPVKDEPPIVLSWKELCNKLAPSGDVKALSHLRLLQVNSFVGLTRTRNANGQLGNFILTNVDRSGHLKRVMDKDPTFSSRLVEVYRVEELSWDAKMVEFEGVAASAAR